MKIKPIMSPDVERQCMNAITMFKERIQWRAWGLNRIRQQGACILLYGPPGTGKTVIAEWLSMEIVKKGLKEVSFADFGSHIPGENARQIRAIFAECAEKENKTIFLDECDAILWDRSLAGGDSMWALEYINELLVQIGKYKGLVILSTNRVETLDSALERRILAKVNVGIPGHNERIKLWKMKMPPQFPVKLTLSGLEELARFVLTGAEIEKVIIEAASDAIREKRKPELEDLCNVAKTYHRER